MQDGKISPGETINARNQVNLKEFIVLIVFGVFLIFVLFEVELGQDVGRSDAIEVPDPVIEAQYKNCYANRDDAMHRQAFSTIDNPDVQREFISAKRAEIAAECRAQFPQKMIVLENEDSAALIRFRPRYW